MCDGGVIVDLRPMRGFGWIPSATATVQAGVLLGGLDQETQELGLAVPSGIVTHTGVAGLTLGGGIGWLMRKHGLTIDQLLVGRSGDGREASSCARREDGQPRALLGHPAAAATSAS